MPEDPNPWNLNLDNTGVGNAPTVPLSPILAALGP